MSVIGNSVQSVPFITDTFSGNASTVNFTLTRAPAGTASIAVFISGVYQAPTAYSLIGDVITFGSAPTSGTNNLVILHLGNGSTTQVPSDGSVTTQTIAAGAVTGNKLGLTAINANNIVDGTITLAKISSGVLPSAIANSAAIYANGAFAAANAASGTDTTQNNSITVALNTANAAFAAANTANTPSHVANSAAIYANGAFTSSNTKATIASPSFTGFVGMGGKIGTVALDVNGAIHGNTIFRNTEGGSAAVPSFQPGNDNDTGMFHGGSNIIGFSTGGIERLQINASGTVTLANGLSIGRTAVTGTPAATDGNVFSGTYTPTLTNSTGVGSSAASACQYMRVGNVVTVSGQVMIAGDLSLNMKMSLPIASAFTASRQAAGFFYANTAFSPASSGAGGAISADIAGDRFLFLGGDDSSSNLTYIFTTTYQVL